MGDVQASMSQATSDLPAYLNSLHRKLQVAKYHLDQLALAAKTGLHEPIPIPLQAHFEGVLTSVVAASDKLAEVINIMLSLGIRNATIKKLLIKILQRGDPLPDWYLPLKTWHEAPIAADVRAIRNLAVHHHYRKSSRGLSLEVQLPPHTQAPYSGSRELVAYCTAVVQHANQCGEILDALEAPQQLELR
jgi:hypothetical protein